MKITPADIEERARKVLGTKLGKTFHKRKLTIGCDSNGKDVKHEFDLVSEDKEIVGEVKSGKLGNESTKEAGYSSTRKFRLIGDIFYLERTKASHKLLILTDKDLFDKFRKDMDGLLTTDIEIIHLPIS